jgi:asparagine synthase (glutamine-hydrolysing)
MAVEAGGERRWRHWEPDLDLRLRYRSDAEYAEHYRALLKTSVKCCLRSASPPAVMMSGGLDSTSVACVAAREISAAGALGPLRTVSYVFDELTTCDERRYMDALLAEYDIEAIRFAGDDAWPLRDIEASPWSPNGPEGNPHRGLVQRAYARAREGGSRVVLTGWFGDHHYTGTEDWLADLLVDRRFGEAAGALLGQARRAGVRALVSSQGVRRVGRRVLDRVPGGRRLRPPWEPPRAPWLTPHAAGCVARANAWPSTPTAGRRPRQVQRLLGAMAARGATGAIVDASHGFVELRHPYRDRRLVEFMLAIPAHQLYNQGRYKHVLRNAMGGILPEAIRQRERPTSLMPLYARGLVEREWPTVEAILAGRDAGWQDYVQEEWLQAVLPAQIAALQDGAGAWVPWLCIAFELWRQGPERTRAAAQPQTAGLRSLHGSPI